MTCSARTLRASVQLVPAAAVRNRANSSKTRLPARVGNQSAQADLAVVGATCSRQQQYQLNGYH